MRINIVSEIAILLFAFSIQAALSARVGVNPSLDAFVTTGASGNLVNSNYGGAGALSIAAF